ncbi:MAG TPA: hypothetical protein DD379_12560, partial [Cyanobacteria bacterium UBA11162]|nr:hypothetical protein [Cyanobacteria bacterium UBA11162]
DPVTDDDPNTEELPQNPKIDIEKLVSVDGGTTFVDADSAPGPVLAQGTNPIFKFVVTNTGNVTLSNITLSDSDFDLNGLAPGTTINIASLAANDGQAGGADEFSYTFTAPWQSGQHTNTATASTTFNNATISDSDNANYYGFANPQNQRSITVNVPTLTTRPANTRRVNTDGDAAFEKLISYFQITDASDSGSTQVDLLISGLDLDFQYRQGNKWVEIDPDDGNTPNTYDQKTDPLAPESYIKFWVENDGILGFGGNDQLINDPNNPSVNGEALVIKEPIDSIKIGYEVDFSLGAITPPGAPNGAVPDPLRVTAQVGVYNVDRPKTVFFDTEVYDF